MRERNTPLNPQEEDRATTHSKADSEAHLKAPVQAPKAEKNRENAAQTAVLEQALEERTELLQRTRAEFENYQKRSQKEKEAIFLAGEAKTVQSFLPFIDALEDALAHGKPEHQQALVPLAQYLQQLLEKMGLQPIQAKGKKFNHAEHECLLTGFDPQQPEDIVLEELQKGFLFRGMVIRHAKVKINQSPAIEGEKHE